MYNVVYSTLNYYFI